MKPEEVKQFIEEARKRGDERARKWHSNIRVRAIAKADCLALQKETK